MRCAECGGATHKSLGALDIEFKGCKFVLSNISHSVCELCGEVSFAGEELDAYYAAGAKAYRDFHGLLSPHEIVETRKKHGLTQRQFEAALGVAPPPR